MANIETENMGDEKEINPRIYELGFLFVPTIDENAVLGEASRIKGVIESCGGLLISDENPKSITLAYPIDKRVSGKRKSFTTAYFSWIKFHADPSAVATLKKHMEDDQTVMRFLIIKTVKENTLIQKRSFTGVRGKKKEVTETKGEKPKEEVTPVSEAELDKTIEELVIY
ncbi:MAG: 30S ribosomal protein S6 [Candidatus Yonathbacteria bacterium]|nr:30S ribosomal protein S6 [Candidatus Yonathbacteria bacterium]